MGMFGLGKDKKEKPGKGGSTFILEDEMQDPKKHQELVKTLEKRVQLIKEALRKGAEKELYDDFGILLHGYASLLKVVARAKKK